MGQSCGDEEFYVSNIRAKERSNDQTTIRVLRNSMRSSNNLKIVPPNHPRTPSIRRLPSIFSQSLYSHNHTKTIKYLQLTKFQTYSIDGLQLRLLVHLLDVRSKSPQIRRSAWDVVAAVEFQDICRIGLINLLELSAACQEGIF